jgi:hypothetical protein
MEASTWKEIWSSFPRTLLIEIYRPSIPTIADKRSSMTISSYLPKKIASNKNIQVIHEASNQIRKLKII